jgi:hypothetical protein
MKICPVGIEFFHADGQSDVTMVIVAFRNSANRKCQKACLGFDVLLVLDVVVAHWLNPGTFVDIVRTKRHPDIFVHFMIDYNH